MIGLFTAHCQNNCLASLYLDGITAESRISRGGGAAVHFSPKTYGERTAGRFL